MSKNIEASFNVELKELNSNLVTLSKLSGRFTKTTLIQIRVLRTVLRLLQKASLKKFSATQMAKQIFLYLSLCLKVI